MGIPAPNPSSDCCFSGVTGAAQPVTQPIEIQKPDGVQYVPTSYEETGTCIPLFAKVECAGGALIEPFPLGYINENGEFTVASNIEVGTSGNTVKKDKVDPTPLFLTGPVAAADIDTHIADLLAASTVTDFPIAGVPILPEHIITCGSVSFVDMNGHRSIVLNGQTDTPVANWTDSDGVNGTNTIEVLEGCTVAVTACAFKEYELDKAGEVIAETKG